MTDDNSPSLPRPVDNSPGLSRHWSAVRGDIEGMTITELIQLLDNHDKRLFACECAERVLPIYGAEYPDDVRPRQALETVRRYLDGNATDVELAVTAEAAGEAAQEAAGPARRHTWPPAACVSAVWAVWTATGWEAAAWSAWRTAAALTAEWAALAVPTPNAERGWQHARLVALVLAARVNANS